MRDRLLSFEIEGGVCDPRVAWSVLGDTDWMNRVAGSGRLLDMEHVSDREGLPRLVGRFEGAFGREPTFEETHSSWVYQRRFLQVRTWEGGLLETSRYDVRLEPEGDGVRPILRLEIEPIEGLLGKLCRLGMAKHEKVWRGVVERLPAPGALPTQAGGPARALEPEVLRLVRRWSARVGREDLAERLEELFRRGRPIELQQIRPFVLADRWDLDREQTLEAMLHGVVDGVFELAWSVRCPMCHGQVAQRELLEDVSPDAACPTCRIAFECDLDETIEAVLAPHPSLRLRPEETFCTLFPSASPAMHAVFLLGPGGQASARVPLDAGAWRLTAGRDLPPLRLDVDPEAEGRGLRWSSAESHEGAIPVRQGDLELSLHNPTEAWVRVVISPEGRHDDRVTGTRLATLPLFRRLMGHQVLSPGMRVRVRQVSIMFTDLTSSVAFYARLGDAPAWAFVRDHLAWLTERVEASGGVVVKSVGDALMAAWDEPRRAVVCALDMLDGFPAWVQRRELERAPSLRVAVHTGPCLAVRSPASGIDFFGMTVNLAARLEKLSTGDDVILSESVLDAPGVAELLASREERIARHVTHPKGLQVPMVAVRLRGPSAPESPSPGKSA